MSDGAAEGLDGETLEELHAVRLVRGRPLLAVDCDEVLVALSAHLARWLPGTGHQMRMTQYRLEGTMFRENEDVPLAFDECLELVDRFFREQTLMQREVEGAAAAIRRLAEAAQVVVLTNVPRFAGPDRRRNLADLGIDHPVVVNGGGKGRALAWLADRAAAPAAFIDDSPLQHQSAARRAPHVARIHFVGAPGMADLLRETPEGAERAHDWPEAERLARRALGL